MNKLKLTIIGGGPAAMMLACCLDNKKFEISIYEKNSALGRKFLVAGKGGFNLTHSENVQTFAERYNPKTFIEPFLNHFTNSDFRKWLSGIGIETYVGSSKRVFPTKGIKPIEVLKAIEEQLIKNKVSCFYNHSWQGWKDESLVFKQAEQLKLIKTDIVVFALGGGSWKVTGSDGTWLEYFKERGISINPFYPSNCAYKVSWPKDFIAKQAGSPLKNCTFYCDTKSHKGEAVITDFGIEGSGIYPLSFEVRKQLVSKKSCRVYVDFKPELSCKEIQHRFESYPNLSVKDVLEKKINLSVLQIELLKQKTTKEQYHHIVFISELIKKYPIEIIDFAPLDDAISTVGGIALEEVTTNLELKKLKNHYCLGEMLDWDAPTGGYLLQACFSMGKYLATILNSK